ncbi:MAG: hypothetical protein IKN07_11620 [Lachnospiraceae bacterium]|nr:hypothetical protein [Lachnospiraceae bacterium]MBR3736522.1 hypothetical protein [Lachnospiraceae bacterium]
MFVEITEEAYQQVKDPLKDAGYAYNTSDVTMPKDSIRHIRLDFSDDLNKQDAQKIADMLDVAYRVAAVKSEKAVKQAVEEYVR